MVDVTYPWILIWGKTKKSKNNISTREILDAFDEMIVVFNIILILYVTINYCFLVRIL